MRKLMIAAAGAAVIMAMAASPGEAGNAARPGTGPRLDGSFAVTAVIRSNDIGIPSGTETSDTYVFKSTCGAGACKRVGLTRESGGRNVKSTLRKTKPGVYEGNEGPEPYTCVSPIGKPGQFTAHHKIKVTKSKNGRATKIAGQTKVRITGCKETFEDVDLRGKKVQG